MAHEVVIASNDDWEVLCRTWYTGCFSDGHEWTVYMMPWEEPPRYAVRYRSMPYLSEVEEDDVAEPDDLDSEAPDDENAWFPRRLPERTVELDNTLTSALLAEGAIPIQIVGQKSLLGLDGWHRGYVSGDYRPEVQLSWWCEGPKEWEPFVAWVDRLQRHLHRELFPNEPEVPPVLRP